MKYEDNSQNKRSFHKGDPRRDGGNGRPSFPKKRFTSRRDGDEGEEGEDKPKRFGRPSSGDKKRPFSKDRPQGGRGRGGKRPFPKREDEGNENPRPFRKERSEEESSDRPRRSFSKDRPQRRPDDRPRRSFSKERPDAAPKRPRFNKDENARPRRDVTAESEILTEIVEKRRREGRPSPEKVKVRSLEFEEQYLPVRLNKYIANAGVCSRREADTLIAAGAISVNGTVVTELGFKVKPTDEVRFGDTVLQREKPVYLLLNKPKDYITTMEDEFDRKHVLQLVRGACKERIYPVGRLDRDTTGLLLFTNDGDLTKKLTHPRSGVRKIYHVTLDKNIKQSELDEIATGIELEDGTMAVDEISFVGEHKNEVGVVIHSGKNRIVRRIFESLGYEVIKLDRVVFAGLTKKDLPRGSWRFLTQEEINFLKMTVTNK